MDGGVGEFVRPAKRHQPAAVQGASRYGWGETQVVVRNGVGTSQTARKYPDFFASNTSCSFFNRPPLAATIPPMRMFTFMLLCCFSTNFANAANRPNFLIVMADDLGFSDLGCYGSEIETPNLDALAQNGLRFSQFYNTAKCHSSRISLLTGRYAFQAGNTSLSRATTSAEVLGKAGYFTAMSGKWHLDKQPTDFGFQRYFGHLSGACNFYRGDKTFRLNGEPWNVPESGFYTTVAKVDFALKFLKEARTTKKPWYLYLAFNAPHAPLQPLKQDYEKYLGRYDAGWDLVREARVAKQRKLGLFGKDVKPSPRPDHIPAWRDMPKDRQAWEIKRMTALAGMIDRIDQELGRVIADLKRAGEFENTFILFVSDNGACPYDRRSPKLDRMPYEPDVTWSDSTGWAWARNSPFRYYKQNQFEGGICTPGVVHWPAGLKHKPGSITHEPAHLVDVLPTLADMGKADIPTTWPGRELEPVSGTSLLPHLQGRKLSRKSPIHFLFSDDRALREGDWKLVSFRRQPWELYNVANDRTELNDVARQHPARLNQMARRWSHMTEHVLKAPPKANTPVEKKASGHLHPEWTDFKQPLGEIGKRRTSTANGRSKGGQRRPDKIRARKNTQMRIKGNEVRLEFTSDDDPGIAIDRIKDLGASGPYELTFRLKSAAGSQGELFVQTNPGQNLPNSPRTEFKILPDNEWRDISIKIDTTKTILGLRLDTGDTTGTSVITGLTLRSADGKALRTWPR